jgi:pimeloyl-ACP methyl ester carboxylesterase
MIRKAGWLGLLLLCCSPGYSAVFHPAPCAFEPAKNAAVQCGWLEVAECHSKPRSRKLRLHVARYRSTAAVPSADPILWLVGGPGGHGHVLSTVLFDHVVRPYLAKRDFIVLDPRGVGYSQPSLQCAEADRACYEGLKASGCSIECYNSIEFAADLEDLRRALGVRQWNLMGESYGTHLALVAMRLIPEGIRSVVLDSVLPPGFDNRSEDHRWMRNAMRRLIANCERDTACRSAFPQLASAYDDAARALSSHPRRIAGSDRGVSYDFPATDRSLPLLLFLLLYDSQGPASVPVALHTMARGEIHPAWHKAAVLHAAIEKHLANATVNVLWSCNDSGTLPGFRNKCAETGLSQQIEWPAAPSWIPTLILAGEYDPATPPEAARHASLSLSKSQLFVLKGYGHMVTAAGRCPTELIQAFLDAPCQYRLKIPLYTGRNFPSPHQVVLGFVLG